MSVPAGFDSRDAVAANPSVANPPRPLRASRSQNNPVNRCFLDNREQRYPLPEKASFYGRVVRSVVGVRGVPMNIDDSRLIVRFQRLITEMLVEKRLGQRRPGLTDDLYQTWREVGRRGLREAPGYRDVLLRADRHALWLAGLVRLAAPPVSSPETERTDTLDGPQKAA